MSHTDFNQQKRVAALARSGLRLDFADQDFQLLVTLAQQLMRTPMAAISFFDDTHQHFSASIGFSVEKLHREQSFCDRVIRTSTTQLVEDTLKDAEFCRHPFVTHEPKIRFYCGVPIHAPDGVTIGSLCVLDTVPHHLSQREVALQESLAVLADRLIARKQQPKDPRLVSPSQLNRAIVRAQNVLLQTDDNTLTFSTLLDDILELTGCNFGLIGEVLHDESDAPYLKVHSLTNIAWNEETAVMYQQAHSKGLEFRNLDNLLGYAIKHHTVVISNDPTNDPRSGGNPHGHPSINSYMGIPVFSGSLLVGLIGLANRPEGFNQAYADSLEALTSTVGILLERKRMLKERAAYHTELHFAAYHDALTSLPNRRQLDLELETAIARQDARYVEPLTLCYFDLDGFKPVNDLYGHAVGDVLLVQLSQRLSRELPADAQLYRISGDEFAVLLHGTYHQDFYQHMLRVIQQAYKIEAHRIEVSASMGVSVYPYDCKSAHQLIRNADQSMYKAKRLGKNRCVVFDASLAEHEQTSSLVREQVRCALRKKEIVAYLQPKVDLQSGQIDGFEMLCRWQKERHQVLSPASFLPHIQDSEVMIELDKYMLKLALECLASFEQQGLECHLSVNVSAHFFTSENFLQFLQEHVQEHAQLIPRLTLEIVESVALGDLEQATERLQACRNLGLRIALDDFGTGYCSLTYFKALPIDEVKIDRTFVKDFIANPDNEAILTSIISLTHQFGRRVVAEGVEDKQQAQRLRELACDSAQGFYFSKPLSVQDAITLLRGSRL